MMPMLVVGVRVVVPDDARVAALQQLKFWVGVDEGADDQSVVAQPHVAHRHRMSPVHQAVPDIHTDCEHRALGWVRAAARLVPPADGLWVRLLVGVIVVVARREGVEDRGQLHRRPCQEPPRHLDRLVAVKSIRDPAGVDHRQCVADRAAEQDHRVEARDQAVPEHPVEQRHGAHVEDDIAEEVELAQPQRHVHVRGRQQSCPDDNQHVKNLSANHRPNTDVGRMEDGDGVQRHLRAVAAEGHERRSGDVVGDLEPLADDLDGAHEVNVAHEGHAPEEVEDCGPPEPAQVGDVDYDVLCGEAERRGPVRERCDLDVRCRCRCTTEGGHGT
mmetsp:Transcript_49451/g.139188  ORF Transcript_49451/g.139188 Transcript_49451/m.139188 type:complete len:330 (+) Transcript_49451:1100-2089(+)